MTERFHEGQEVEVRTAFREQSPAAPYGGVSNWCKAKVIYKTKIMHEDVAGYMVKFPDGTHAVFDGEHIRAVGLDMIDLGAEALRQRMQGGKQIRPWGTLTNSSKRKWRDYARVVLCAAKVLP